MSDLTARFTGPASANEGRGSSTRRSAASTDDNCGFFLNYFVASVGNYFVEMPSKFLVPFSRIDGGNKIREFSEGWSKKHTFLTLLPPQMGR